MSDKKAILSVVLGTTDESDNTSVKCTGSPIQVLGMVARARIILKEIEDGVITELTTKDRVKK